MDARTLSRVTGVQAGTINAWVQRGYVPGMDVEVSGRKRNFDLETAVHIGIMAELMPFGFGASSASFVAKHAAAPGVKKPRCMITGPLVGPRGNDPEIVGFTPTYFDSDKTLPEALAQLRDRSPDGRAPPGAYMVINIEEIESRMRRAEEEWRQSQNTRRGRGADVR